MSARQYVLIFAPLLFVLLGLVVYFNRIVDPFWYYRDVSIVGFNSVKPRFLRYERHVKPSILQREQPASVIFGSSYAEIGFDPLHPALRATGKSYNFGLAGASWEIVSCNVQFALSHDFALRQIVLGIHPGTMPQQNCADEIVKMEHPDEKAFLLSYDAFESAVRTILEQRKQKPTHTAEGMYFYTRGLPATAGRFREYFAQHTPCKITHAVEQQPDGDSHAPGILPEGSQPVADLSGLRDVVSKAVARGIVVKLVVYPRHALLLEQEYQCGMRQSRWNALAQIVSMVGQEAGGLAEVWDFEGYHEIGTEVITDAPGAYWQDPAHFNYEFGNIMLDEMFAMKPPMFGTRITLANLATHADMERKMRSTYIGSHPKFLRQLEDLLPHHAN